MNTEAIKQFLVGTVIPAIAGAGAAWLASKGVLNVFGISSATATTDLDELGVFVIVTGSGWLTSHHILLGKYSPPAKAQIAARAAILTAEANTEAARTPAADLPLSFGTVAPSPPVEVHIHNAPPAPGKVETGTGTKAKGAAK